MNNTKKNHPPANALPPPSEDEILRSIGKSDPYFVISQALGCHFDLANANLLQTYDEALEEFRSALSNRSYRSAIEQEVRQAFEDRRDTWLILLKKYDIEEIDSDQEAHEYAVDTFWNILFPDEESPKFK